MAVRMTMTAKQPMPHCNGVAPLRCVVDAAQSTDLYVVSEVLGHLSLAITKDVYGHLVEGRKRAVAARMSEAVPAL
jgi:integrase